MNNASSIDHFLTFNSGDQVLLSTGGETISGNITAVEEEDGMVSIEGVTVLIDRFVGWSVVADEQTEDVQFCLDEVVSELDSIELR
mgnify:CR=1 FL=1